MPWIISKIESWIDSIVLRFTVLRRRILLPEQGLNSGLIFTVHSSYLSFRLEVGKKDFPDRRPPFQCFKACQLLADPLTGINHCDSIHP
jgi:hypothetical protein